VGPSLLGRRVKRPMEHSTPRRGGSTPSPQVVSFGILNTRNPLVGYMKHSPPTPGTHATRVLEGQVLLPVDALRSKTLRNNVHTGTFHVAPGTYSSLHVKFQPQYSSAGVDRAVQAHHSVAASPARLARALSDGASTALAEDATSFSAAAPLCQRRISCTWPPPPHRLVPCCQRVLCCRCGALPRFRGRLLSAHARRPCAVVAAGAEGAPSPAPPTSWPYSTSPQQQARARVRGGRGGGEGAP
jgi:hypothetical protein